MTNRREELTQASCNQCGELVGMYGETTMTHVLQAFKMGAKWADSHPKNPWHKVIDGDLPEDGMHILFTTKTQYGNVYDVIYYPEPPLTDEMEYWMEIPELPKEDAVGVKAWQDVRKIVTIADDMVDEDVKGNLEHLKSEEDYYTEVLRRFMEG